MQPAIAPDDGMTPAERHGPAFLQRAKTGATQHSGCRMSAFDSPEERIRAVGGRMETPPTSADRQAADTESEGLLQCGTLTPVDIPKIPPRPWAYGKFLQFGQAAALGGVDGSGKGSMAVTIALAMITGRPLLDERIWRRGPV